MRKLVILLCLVFLCAAMALAQGKVATTWSCAKPDPMNSLQVGDQPNHAYSIAQVKCTATKGEIAGIKEKEGTATEFNEVKGDHSSGHGIFVETLSNGDKIRYTYQPMATFKNGQMQSGSNKWEMMGESGKVKGLKGSGGCTGKGNPDGSATYTCTGTYTTPKK